MKKLLVVALVAALSLSLFATPASACVRDNIMVAVSDSGGSAARTNNSRNSNSTNQTASSGGVNQNATVTGDNNAVNIRQVVNNGGGTYYTTNQTVNNTTVIQVVQVVEPAPQPHPDYEKMKKTIAIYGEAFMAVLSEHLSAEGWSIVYSVENVMTHNWVVSIKLFKGDVMITGYKILYYSSDGETYVVALTTAYHEGMRIKEYPESQIIFRGASEEVAIANIMVWLHTFIVSTEITVTTGTGCHCCAECSCECCNAAPASNE